MRNNKIEGGVNNIIAGSYTTIPADVSNTFVWSTQSFTPTESDTFYINSKNGVGINETNPQAVFDSNGAVKF